MKAPTLRSWLLTGLATALAACGSSPSSPGSPSRPDTGGSPLVGTRRVEGVLHDSLGALVEGARIETNGALVQFTDAQGAFVFPVVTISDGLVHLKISKQGYHTMYDKLILGNIAPPTLVVNDIVLLLASLVLPVDGVLPLVVSPTDPSDYVGEIYISDTCYHCIDIEFTTPADADLVVTLSAGAVTTEFQLWALGGAIVGIMQAPDRRVLTLPRGIAGPLKVGAVSSGFGPPVSLTLSTASRK